MKKVIFIALILLTGCITYKTIPLKSKYDDRPFELITPSNFETVWGKIIEMFAKQGIGVKIIDKSSGFIVANNTSARFTSEDKYGKLIDPTAWAVTTKTYDPYTKKYFWTKTGTIEWNIYVKQNPNNTTTININLISVEYMTYTNTLYKGRALTTGVFENKIVDIIK